MALSAPGDPALFPESLATALLLAATAGVLDAATYLLHGRVFATAMTGNTVLLGISALSANWYELVRHLVPIAAFVAGVAASKVARVALGSRGIIVGLLVEIVALVVAGFLPSTFPEMLFTGAISFVCAVQVAGLRYVGPYTYNSTFVTGDLLQFIEGMLASANSQADQGRRRSAASMGRDLGLVWTAFALGAVGGALAAPRMGNRAYWTPVPVLLAILAVVGRRMRASGQPEARMHTRTRR